MLRVLTRLDVTQIEEDKTFLLVNRDLRMETIYHTRELLGASIPAYHLKGKMIDETTKVLLNDGSPSCTTKARKHVHYLRTPQSSLTSGATNRLPPRGKLWVPM